jgi:hypothetical protein
MSDMMTTATQKISITDPPEAFTDPVTAPSPVLINRPLDNFEEYPINEFLVAADGLYTHQGENKIKFTSNFVEVKAIGCDGSSDQWSIILEFYNLKNECRTKLIPFTRLTGDFPAIMAELSNQGFIVDASCGNRWFKNYLTCASVYLTTRHVRLITKIGFFPLNPKEPDGAFGYALPSNTIFAPNTDNAPDVLFVSPVPSPTHAAYHAAGDLETYVAVLEPAKGNVLWVFAFCVGLAAIMREVIGSENFGVHIYGESSTGKSTGGQIAMSIVGCCADSQQSVKPTLRQSWVTTTNAIELMAAAHSGHALFLDELGAMSAAQAMEIYPVIQGQGKTRMSQHGSMQDRLTWSILVLSTGELSMRERILQEPNRKIKEGEMIRILDIPVDNLPLDTSLTVEEREQLAITLKAFLSDNYGVVGIKFIEEIIAAYSNLQELKMDLNSRVNLCYEALCAYLVQIRPSLSSLHKRAVKHFAIIWAAGQLAVEAEVSPFSEEDIEFAISNVARVWLEDFPLAENEQLLLQVKKLVNNQRLQIVNTDIGKARDFLSKKPDILLHDGKIWLSPAFFEAACDEQFNVLRASKLLYNMGALHRPDGSDQYKIRVSVWPEVFGKASRYYALNATKLFTVEELEKLTKLTEQAMLQRPNLHNRPVRRTSYLPVKQQVIPVESEEEPVNDYDYEDHDVDYNNYEEDDAEPIDDEYADDSSLEDL